MRLWGLHTDRQSVRRRTDSASTTLLQWFRTNGWAGAYVEFKDYYKIMGVDESATADDIKKAYKKLARRYHPDVSKEKNAEQMFKDVGEAYEVLKDADKRREYDQMRAGAMSGNGAESGFSDFFEAMFGRGGGFRHNFGDGGSHIRMHGEDTRVELPLLLEEAFAGGERLVELRVPEIDERGLRTRKLKIKVPPGSGEGSVLRIKGQGQPGIGGGEAGDLLLTVRLASHPLYTIDGKDLTLVAPLTPWEAALGSKLTVPTLKGRTLVTVPAGSHSGRKLRLAGQGMPGSPPGDFFVVLKVVLPPDLTDTARPLYEGLAQQYSTFNPRAAWERP